jgi:hypothetical protein
MRTFFLTAIVALVSSQALAEDLQVGRIIYTPIDTGDVAEVAAGAFADDNGISYHGGPVMGTNPDGSNIPNMYFVWYGNWDGNTALTILPDFASNFGGSPYYNINTSYTDGLGNPVINAVSFGGSAFDNYSQGTSLTAQRIATIVRDAIDRADLPLDREGVYMVLTSADVADSGFCRHWCGWHTWFTHQSTPIKFSFIGNPERCLNGCARNRVTSPNDNLGADGMANLIAHEFEEAVTDPQLNAWFDSSGQENADKCAWTFGSTFTEPNGSIANMTLGTRDYLIQRNWVNDSGGYCATSY